MAHTYTWDKLVKNATRLNPKSRGANYPYTPKFERPTFEKGENKGQPVIIPFIGTKSVLVKLKAWGVTQNNIHNITLLFNDCDIIVADENTEKPNYNYFSCTYKGKIYHIKKFDKLRNPLTHRCDCADFFFTWAWGNYYNGHCLYGPPPKPYVAPQRKLPFGTRPRNPRSYIGVCKHIYNAWDYLKREGLTLN